MKNIIEKIRLYQDVIFLVAVIMLTGLVGFGLGRLSAKYQTAELKIQSTLVNTADLNKTVTGPQEKTVVKKIDSPSSKNGGEAAAASNAVDKKIVGNKNSKIYHYEDCPGALKMKGENKVYFASALDAKNAGYRPAGNCPGLE